MTNEEKAEYLESLFQKVCDNVDCPKESDCTTCRIKVVKGIELGLAEGRKEVTYMTADEYDKTLDKCKECYLDMVDKFSKRNADLEKTVEELTMKIEKMKKFLPSYIVNKYFKEDNDENN